MRPTLLSAAILVGLVLTFPVSAGAQEHAHAEEAPEATGDPLLRLVLEGPHLVLAHHGFITLSAAQLDTLHAARSRVCAAEVAYVHERTQAMRSLAGVLATGEGDTGTREAVERLARAEADWMLALVRARQETLSTLPPADRDQLAWLGAHWAREAREMIAAATHGGHRGHRGVQLPIRVPGMIVTDTTLAPVCDALHGPAVHLSIPPPGR